jgi:hypothetical protein
MSHNTGIEERSCAPGIVIAGFAKSASSFLFNVLAAHPLVLPALRGAHHKESRCYAHDPRHSPNQLADRAWCFPFVEEGEGFLSMDGTVGYSSQRVVPYTLKADNPDVKVLFVVRHPVDRLYSSFKSSTGISSTDRVSLDDLLAEQMAEDGGFAQLRQMVTNGTDLSQVVDHYYALASELRSGDVGLMLLNSIFFPPVLHFSRVLGGDSVMVINSEDLDAANSTLLNTTLSGVFRFLGVCVPDGLLATIVDRSVSEDAGNAFKPVLTVEAALSQDMYSKLQMFMEPFNRVLVNITLGSRWQRDLGSVNVSHWSSAAPPSHLPLFSRGMNSSRPPMWFETQFGDHYQGKLVPHLLPQR